MIMYFNVKRVPEDKLLKPTLTSNEEGVGGMHPVVFEMLQVYFCLNFAPYC